MGWLGRAFDCLLICRFTVRKGIQSPIYQVNSPLQGKLKVGQRRSNAPCSFGPQAQMSMSSDRKYLNAPCTYPISLSGSDAPLVRQASVVTVSLVSIIMSFCCSKAHECSLYVINW